MRGPGEKVIIPRTMSCFADRLSDRFIDRIRLRIFSKIGGLNRQIERANAKFDR